MESCKHLFTSLHLYICDYGVPHQQGSVIIPLISELSESNVRGVVCLSSIASWISWKTIDNAPWTNCGDDENEGKVILFLGSASFSVNDVIISPFLR